MQRLRKTDPRGRKPARNSIRYISVGVGKRRLRLIFSRDMVMKMLAIAGTPWTRRYGKLQIYFQWERWPYHAPHALLLKATFMPAGEAYKLTQSRTSPRFIVEVPARIFEVAPSAPGHTFKVTPQPERGGLLVEFPLEVMNAAALERWARIDSARKRNEAAPRQKGQPRKE